MKQLFYLILCFLVGNIGVSQETYAEKLGFPKESKVLILHIDDIGMSHDSNAGTIQALEEGMANSVSMMMPCAWIPEFMEYLKENPETDAGLHLTLTSEWDKYRWGPLAGKNTVPGLTDAQWAFWPSVPEVVQHANADEIEIEIRAQIQRSRDMGWEPTHLDSHMGTLYANQGFLERYIKVGIEEQIPIMFPGGHNTYISANSQAAMNKEMTTAIGKKLWNAGLPVIDDLHPDSYIWDKNFETDEALADYKTDLYIKAIEDFQPGITVMLMHCTSISENFEHISNSGPTRKGDLLAMLSPRLKKYIEDNNIILTTWRELNKRRKAL